VLAVFGDAAATPLAAMRAPHPPSVRDYHSVAFLLPSGQVAMAGWNNAAIEIFSPPYLHRGPRPVISAAPSSVDRGEEFTLESPQAATISKVVFVRPMAVTHETDTEQKVLELPFVRTGFSTFGTISTTGTVTDRFGVGNNFDALTFAQGNVGYGPSLFYYLRRDVTELTVTAPDGGPPHALAQQGYYMLFALNGDGVPSVAEWVRLQ
jgi:hypothetical protein